MVTINVEFTAEEHEALLAAKGTLNWHDFIILMPTKKTRELRLRGLLTEAKEKGTLFSEKMVGLLEGLLDSYDHLVSLRKKDDEQFPDGTGEPSQVS